MKEYYDSYDCIAPLEPLFSTDPPLASDISSYLDFSAFDSSCFALPSPVSLTHGSSTPDSSTNGECEEEESSKKTTRKEAHSLIERRYRDNLNSKITELRDLLPCFSGSKRINKASVLKEAALHITRLTARNKELEMENSLLKASIAIAPPTPPQRESTSSVYAFMAMGLMVSALFPFLQWDGARSVSGRTINSLDSFVLRFDWLILLPLVIQSWLFACFCYKTRKNSIPSNSTSKEKPLELSTVFLAISTSVDLESLAMKFNSLSSSSHSEIQLAIIGELLCLVKNENLSGIAEKHKKLFEYPFTWFTKFCNLILEGLLCASEGLHQEAHNIFNDVSREAYKLPRLTVSESIIFFALYVEVLRYRWNFLSKSSELSSSLRSILELDLKLLRSNIAYDDCKEMQLTFRLYSSLLGFSTSSIQKRKFYSTLAALLNCNMQADYEMASLFITKFQ